MTEPLLSVRNLRTSFDTDDGLVRAVDDVSFDIFENEVFCVVGESGSGKSVTALSILNLIPKATGHITGELIFKGEDLLKIPEVQMRHLRGNRIAMIFQDPLTALNPVFTVGHQISEVFRVHSRMSRQKARRQAVELLGVVGIPRPHTSVDEYPHQFSGGMRQRVMIAMAIALHPDLLIADEPTTALDVTIQAQVLEVLHRVQKEFNTSIMLITHDLGVVAGMADRVMVMYGGKVAEKGVVDDIFYDPKHPYTWGLMTSITRLDQARKDRLLAIQGSPPSLLREWQSCPFAARCPFVEDICLGQYPSLRASGAPGHIAACHFAARPDWKPPAELVAEKI